MDGSPSDGVALHADARLHPMAAPHADALLNMQQRAAHLATCSARWVGRHEAPRGKYFLWAHGQVNWCRPAHLAFIHIFKAASSTVGAAFKRACSLAHGADGVTTLCGRSQNDSWCQGSLEVLIGENVTYFTVVRNPIDRWPSGVYEQARRGLLPEWLYNMARSKGVSEVALASAAFKEQSGASSRGDPHVQPQTDFVSINGGFILPRLEYVARLEELESELIILMNRFFGSEVAQSLPELLQAMTLRNRSSESYSGKAEHHRGTRFLNLPTSAVLPQLSSYYARDIECLGYT